MTGKIPGRRAGEYTLLGAGARVKGPAVIELPFTTALVPPGFQVTVDDYLNLVMNIF